MFENKYHYLANAVFTIYKYQNFIIIAIRIALADLKKWLLWINVNLLYIIKQFNAICLFYWGIKINCKYLVKSKSEEKFS